MGTLSVTLYRDMLISLRRGNYNGSFSNAKPLFLIALIDAISNNIISKNHIAVTNIPFIDFYTLQFKRFNQGIPTPFEKPYFHLHSEPFYELVWNETHQRPKLISSPSAKYLREHLKYAKLEEDLWELLQNPENREYLKQAIIDTYLNRQDFYDQ